MGGRGEGYAVAYEPTALAREPRRLPDDRPVADRLPRADGRPDDRLGAAGALALEPADAAPPDRPGQLRRAAARRPVLAVALQHGLLHGHRRAGPPARRAAGRAGGQRPAAHGQLLPGDALPAVDHALGRERAAVDLDLQPGLRAGELGPRLARPAA